MADVAERLLTARQVADMLGMNTETVLRWVRDGKLPAIRLPAIRFRPSELETWLEARSTGLPPAPAERSLASVYDASRAGAINATPGSNQEG